MIISIFVPFPYYFDKMLTIIYESESSQGGYALLSIENQYDVTDGQKALDFVSCFFKPICDVILALNGQ